MHIVRQFTFIRIAILSLVFAGCAHAATWYVAPNGNDSNSCTSAASPCLTINGAYQKSGLAGGDTIQLAAGNYGSQNINSKASAPTSNVIVAPVSGATVRFDGIKINGADRIEIRDVTTDDGFVVGPGSSYITSRNVKVTNGYLSIGGGAHIYFYGGEVYGAAGYHSNIGPGPGGWAAGEGTDFVFDGVWFHDIIINQTGQHGECFQINGSKNLVIRNSKFGPRCDVFGVSFTSYNDAGPNVNVLLENNFFHAPTSFNGSGTATYAVNLSWMQGGTVRFNSSAAPFLLQGPSGSGSGTLTFAGNNISGGMGEYNTAANRSGCPGSTGIGLSVSSAYNVGKPGFTCTGQTDAPAGFVNASTGDLHLVAGTTAVDFVPTSVPGGCPATDIDRLSRPVGAGCDAGASERGGTSASGSAPAPPTGLAATVR
jgi:hypothetical protein